jgi:glycerol uptake facilitator-like aquaporin
MPATNSDVLRGSSRDRNPAVSLVMSIGRELAWSVLPLFVIAQLVGGYARSLVAHGMFDLPLSQHGRTGINQWLAEFVVTFRGSFFTIIATVSRRD